MFRENPEKSFVKHPTERSLPPRWSEHCQNETCDANEQKTVQHKQQQGNFRKKQGMWSHRVSSTTITNAHWEKRTKIERCPDRVRVQQDFASFFC